MIYENRYTTKHCKCCPYHNYIVANQTSDLRETLINNQQWETEPPYVSNIFV